MAKAPPAGKKTPAKISHGTKPVKKKRKKEITNVVVSPHPDSYHVPADHGICRECGNPIHTMVFRGSGYCSEKCRKAQTEGSEEAHGG